MIPPGTMFCVRWINEPTLAEVITADGTAVELLIGYPIIHQRIPVRLTAAEWAELNPIRVGTARKIWGFTYGIAYDTTKNT